MPRFHFDSYLQGRWISDEEGIEVAGQSSAHDKAVANLLALAGELSTDRRIPALPLLLKLRVRRTGSDEALHTMSLMVLKESD